MIYGNAELTSLPDCLGQIPNLTYLSIFRNEKLASLPNSICQLTGLTGLSIDVNSSDFVELPNCLGQLTNLTSLGIEFRAGTSRAHLASTSALASAVGLLTNLESLSISPYDGLAANLCQLTKLRRLAVRNNNNIAVTDDLASLVPCLRQLPELTDLNVAFYSLLAGQNKDILPASICQLTNLTSLSLQGKIDMTSLPNCLGQLTNLRTLSVSENNHKPNPSDAICQLTSLTWLAFWYSATSLPDCIGQLPNLASLQFSSTLKSLPTSICPLLPGLHTSDTGHRPISSLVDCTATTTTTTTTTIAPPAS